MLANLKSVAFRGLEGVLVDVEVDVADKGFPGFTIVGLADKAVGEARERVRTALVNSGFSFPQKKITVNLAPANIPKEGSGYDLAIALGILAGNGELVIDQDYLFWGELSLDGGLRHTKGGLLVSMMAKERKYKGVFVPIGTATQAAVIAGVEVYGVRDLCEVVRHFRGERKMEKVNWVSIEKLLSGVAVDFDMAEIVGQESAKRALEIAASGGLNMLMSGPPGAGKTLLSKALPGIMPVMSESEALEVSRIYSVAGMIGEGEAVVRRRPFRAPHTSVSMVGMIGGGSHPVPGEISLAHCGVLFLDEMAEFPRTVLESMRQPLEDGRVEISRASGKVCFPASFSLIGAVNPCPCGFLGSEGGRCRCTDREIKKYKMKISGPILDRIDLHVFVGSVSVSKILNSGGSAESSEMVRKRVSAAREIQKARLEKYGLHTNSQMKNEQIKKYCVLDSECVRFAGMIMEKYNLSARGYFRFLKVVRTIADLDGREEILRSDLAEAVHYRETVF